MAEGIARLQEASDVVGFCEDEIGIQLVDVLAGQPDVLDHQFSDKLAAVGQKLRQLRHLEGDGKVCAHNMAAHVARVVLRHQARRHVYGHNVGRSGIDELHELRISA